ncbi:type III-B CRISPR module-associated protein Cmr5 [Actinokineospora sp.]|uniref:type III-B CRISPR module-associated protein Cmr5 n=1 Tax=Actinokineospora sp. TaxID=1872133 RepID=UPI004037D08B
MSARVDRGLAVAAADALPDQVDNELRSTLRALPVMIHTSGLAAACAYLLSRVKVQQDSDRYFRTTRAVLADAAEFVQLKDREGRKPLELLNELVKLRDQDYIAAERRATVFAGWLARIATARALPAVVKPS